jgi:hypothetical protein
MITKLRNIYRAVLALPQTERKLNELMWANIYRETIKDVPWLKNFSISPGIMAANFSLLYLLAKILKDNKISSILEFGLGQSTRFIESFTIHNHSITRHDVVEDSNDWAQIFDNDRSSQYKTIFPTKSKIKKHDISIQIFKDLKDQIEKSYDLYLIDGPRGLPNYSRYDICEIASSFEINSEFIIIIDDYNRIGEKQTVKDLLCILNEKKIKTSHKVFSGTKDQIVIATEKYKIVTFY